MSEVTQDYQAVVDLPFGSVAIAMLHGKLAGVEYLPGQHRNYRRRADGLDRVLTAIRHYIEDSHADFDIPVELKGTPFQRRVWEALCHIPAGETLTYGQLAERIGSGARAVGNACRANPCPLVVPCHRVVAAKGLGGFAGDRTGKKIVIKRWLLRHEGWL